MSSEASTKAASIRLLWTRFSTKPPLTLRKWKMKTRLKASRTRNTRDKTNQQKGEWKERRYPIWSWKMTIRVLSNQLSTSLIVSTEFRMPTVWLESRLHKRHQTTKMHLESSSRTTQPLMEEVLEAKSPVTPHEEAVKSYMICRVTHCKMKTSWKSTGFNWSTPQPGISFSQQTSSF